MAGEPETDDLPVRARWSDLLRGASDALFVLDRRRRVRFVNPAWEALAGVRAADVRGLSCRGDVGASTGADAVAATLCPPPETFPGGQPGRVRRRYTGADGGRHLWEIDFLPVCRSGAVHAIVGRIRARNVNSAAATLLPDRLLAHRDRAAQAYTWDSLRSDSPAMARVVAQARLAAATGVPVLIAGEPGSGKRWLARVVHHQGETRDRPFVMVDGESLPPAAAAALVRSDIWRTAGTIYVREPGRLPAEVRSRLPQLADAPGGPRLIVGLSADLGAEVAAGRFHDDTYRHLATLEIQVPPLPQRLADLGSLATEFLGRIAEADGRPRATPADDALALLAAYAWPGNLVELLATLRAARAHATGDRIEARDLPAHVRRGAEAPTRRPERTPIDLDAVLAEVERRLITRALREARGNRSRAADSLSIWRARLLRRIEALGIDAPGVPEEDAGEEPETRPTSG